MIQCTSNGNNYYFIHVELKISLFHNIAIRRADHFIVQDEPNETYETYMRNMVDFIFDDSLLNYLSLSKGAL